MDPENSLAVAIGNERLRRGAVVVSHSYRDAANLHALHRRSDRHRHHLVDVTQVDTLHLPLPVGHGKHVINKVCVDILGC